MPLEQIKSGMTSAVASLDTKVKDSLSFLKDAKEIGWEKITSLVNNILGLAPLIEATGFNMKEVSVDASIPPGITLSFLKVKEVDKETSEKVLSENKDKEILNLIVRGLQKADSLQKEMNLAEYKFRGLNMKIGFPPDISLKLVRDDITSK